jgi:hypothetical protein
MKFHEIFCPLAALFLGLAVYKKEGIINDPDRMTADFDAPLEDVKDYM